MNKFSISLVIFCFCVSISSYAQVGIGTTDPDASSILDINSTSAGVLMPRMTTLQREAISNPSNGLLVFDTDLNAFYYYQTDTWIALITESSASDYTGWGDYVDGTYTSASPLSLSGGVQVTLPNDASTVRDSQKPVDVTTFYDETTNTITGRNGDAINIVIEFKARPTTSSSTRLSLSIDIGGVVGEIYPNTFVLSKGQGQEHYYLQTISAYTLDTWETNGGAVKIEASSAAEVYDIRYVIARTHKAR